MKKATVYNVQYSFIVWFFMHRRTKCSGCSNAKPRCCDVMPWDGHLPNWQCLCWCLRPWFVIFVALGYLILLGMVLGVLQQGRENYLIFDVFFYRLAHGRDCDPATLVLDGQSWSTTIVEELELMTMGLSDNERHLCSWVCKWKRLEVQKCAKCINMLKHSGNLMR